MYDDLVLIDDGPNGFDDDTLSALGASVVVPAVGMQRAGYPSGQSVRTVVGKSGQVYRMPANQAQYLPGALASRGQLETKRSLSFWHTLHYVFTSGVAELTQSILVGADSAYVVYRLCSIAGLGDESASFPLVQMTDIGSAQRVMNAPAPLQSIFPGAGMPTVTVPARPLDRPLYLSPGTQLDVTITGMAAAAQTTEDVYLTFQGYKEFAPGR